MLEIALDSDRLTAVARVLLSWSRPGGLAGLEACSRVVEVATPHLIEGAPLQRAIEPEELGIAYEQGLDEGERSRQGSWFTPRGLAAGLSRRAIDLASVDGPVTSVLDPACGGGAFLIGAVREMLSRGYSPEEAFEAQRGFDIDGSVLLVARAALEVLAIESGEAPALASRSQLTHVDFLTTGPNDDGQMSLLGGVEELERVDLVLGNAPFQSQLRSRTLREQGDRESAARAFGGAAGGYVDTALLFLLRATDHVRDSGVISLIVPASVLASRDGKDARARVASRAGIVSFWRDGMPRAFDGGVPVCSVSLRASAAQSTVERTRGTEFDQMPNLELTPEHAADGRWGRLLIDQSKLPSIEGWSTRGTLGDIAAITADFRDQYYGLVGLVREQSGSKDGANPLAVTGTIDPAEFRWGAAQTRFNKQPWNLPVVDRTALEASELAGWAKARLVPKLLVATQTKVIEAFADEDGRLLPCPPLISVVVDPKSLWRAAALLNSPVATIWALLESAGSALSLDAIKLSAIQLRALPLPQLIDSWDRAAVDQQFAHEARTDDARRNYLKASAVSMGLAFGLPEPAARQAAEWWLSRLRGARTRGHAVDPV